MRVPVGMVQPWSSRSSATAAVSRRRHMFFPSGCFHAFPLFLALVLLKKTNNLPTCAILNNPDQNWCSWWILQEGRILPEHVSGKIFYFHVSKFWSGLIERNSSLAPTMSENTQKFISIWKFVSVNKPNWTSTELSKHHTIFIWSYYLYVII